MVKWFPNPPELPDEKLDEVIKVLNEEIASFNILCEIKNQLKQQEKEVSNG